MNFTVCLTSDCCLFNYRKFLLISDLFLDLFCVGKSKVKLAVPPVFFFWGLTGTHPCSRNFCLCTTAVFLVLFLNSSVVCQQCFWDRTWESCLACEDIINLNICAANQAWSLKPCLQFDVLNINKKRPMTQHSVVKNGQLRIKYSIFPPHQPCSYS